MEYMEEGDLAPNFELEANDGSMIKLESFMDKNNVVLCFYPKIIFLHVHQKKYLRWLRV